MTDLRPANLAELSGRYLDRSAAKAAVQMLDKPQPGWTPETWNFVLRDHRIKPVGDAQEQNTRNSIDYLLGYYSLLEVASVAGVVTSPVPEPARAAALQHLTQPSVRAYYEERYPLQLPRLFRSRCEGHVSLVDESRGADMLFFEFLGVNGLLENDQVRSFLWLLDDGEDDATIDELLRSISKPDLFFETLSSDEPRGGLAIALRGFSRYLSFCVDLDALLERALGRAPLLRYHMWLYHEYWFRQMQARVGRRLRKAVERFMEWRDYDDPRAPTVESGVGQWLGILDRLFEPQPRDARREHFKGDQAGAQA